MNSQLFFLLSGEHKTLPSAEVLAILDAENIDYRNVMLTSKVLSLDADESHIRIVIERAAMCEVGGHLIFQCNNDQKEILKRASEIFFTEFLNIEKKFSVRILRTFGSSKHLDKMKLQSRIGDFILNSVPDSKVELEKPQKEFIGIISEERFCFGEAVARKQNLFENCRKPKERPGFHPSTVKPRLARCIVNLARARNGHLLLDPFCGVGGILIEAAALGCVVIGSDRDPKMIRKALKNIKHYSVKYGNVIVADARKEPYFQAQSIATDPPYGRGASTMGTNLSQLLKEFLRESNSILSADGFLCLASPLDIRVQAIGQEAGFNVVESHLMRVHRSLIREIVVFSRNKINRKEIFPWS